MRKLFVVFLIVLSFNVFYSAFDLFKVQEISVYAFQRVANEEGYALTNIDYNDSSVVSTLRAGCGEGSEMLYLTLKDDNVVNDFVNNLITSYGSRDSDFRGLHSFVCDKFAMLNFKRYSINFKSSYLEIYTVNNKVITLYSNNKSTKDTLIPVYKELIK
jgi:hypothetical protein